MVTPILDKTACQPALKRFALAYLAGVLFVIVVSVAIRVLTGIDLPASATGFVPTIVGVSAAATVFVQQHGRASTTEENAYLARQATLISTGISVVLIGLLMAIGMASGEAMSPLGELLSPGGALILLLMLAAVLALMYVFTRFMFRLLTQQMIEARQSR